MLLTQYKDREARVIVVAAIVLMCPAWFGLGLLLGSAIFF
jgi:hypothetical protein